MCSLKKWVSFPFLKNSGASDTWWDPSLYFLQSPPYPHYLSSPPSLSFQSRRKTKSALIAWQAPAKKKPDFGSHLYLGACLTKPAEEEPPSET